MQIRAIKQLIKVAQNRESRLAASSEARIKNAESKAEKAKDPNSSEARATAKLLADQLDMPPEIAGKAAYDYLRRRSDAIKDGEDTDTAEQMAQDYVVGKFSKGERVRSIGLALMFLPSQQPMAARLLLVK